MTTKRNKRGVEARRKEVVWVCRLLVVWCLSWLVSFSCVSMSLSVPSEQRRPDRSCGEVSVIATKKKKDRTESCMLYFVLVVSVFGSVPLLASVDRVSEIVRSLQ